jgi:hypothetical protein
MTPERFNALLKAAEDSLATEWRPVEPCHHLNDGGKFCFLARINHPTFSDHPFVSLADLLREVAGMDAELSSQELETILGALKMWQREFDTVEVAYLIKRIESKRRKEEK